MSRHMPVLGENEMLPRCINRSIWVSFINIYVYRVLVYARRPQEKEKASRFTSAVRTLAAPSLGFVGDRAARWSASGVRRCLGP